MYRLGDLAPSAEHRLQQLKCLGLESDAYGHLAEQKT